MIHLRHTCAEIARVLIGLTLVLSGGLKAVDPIGSALKIGEYLAPILDERWAYSATVALGL